MGKNVDSTIAFLVGKWTEKVCMMFNEDKGMVQKGNFT